MRSIVFQFVGIFCLAAVSAVVAKMTTPPPPAEKAPVCDPTMLKKGEICLATIQEKWKSDVIWIDARSHAEWQRDGLLGSIWLTHDQFDQSFQQAAPLLLGGKPVIVYCSAIGCGTSLEIAERISSFQLAKEVYALHGGWKSLFHAGVFKSEK